MRAKRALLSTALLFAGLAACSAGPVGGAVAVADTVPLTIRSAAHEHRFTIEVARTPEEQARGLMFRKSLPADGGMIFPMTPPREASFWMKNTLIPLDMIFVRVDGSIARIAANTEPHSLTPVSSLEPVAAVLELGGGRAAALGIVEGDRVIWNDPQR